MILKGYAHCGKFPTARLEKLWETSFSERVLQMVRKNAQKTEVIDQEIPSPSTLDVCVGKAEEIRASIGEILKDLEHERQEFLQSLDMRISVLETKLGSFLSIGEKKRIQDLCNFPALSSSIRNESKVLDSLSEENFQTIQELSGIMGLDANTVATIVNRFMRENQAESRYRKSRGRGKGTPEYRRMSKDATL